MKSTPKSRHLILVGGGHAHIQVFREFHRRPMEGLQLTIVADRDEAVYSGMVPGYVAGQYQLNSLTFDLRAWAQTLGAEWVAARAAGIDGAARELLLEDGRKLPYDLCSWNIGSTVAGLDTPGVQAHALATRPIGNFVNEVLPRLRGAIERRADHPQHILSEQPLRILVVGGGAAGVELAFCLQQRAQIEGSPVTETTLLHSNDTLLASAVPSLRKRVARELLRRGILARASQRVVKVHPSSVELRSGERVPFDLCIWATGAASHLGDGWVPVGKTLQHVQHPEVFAVGDCAQLTHAPKTPKAGVYAVREGPILAHNLRAMLGGSSLREYEPQSEFLSLLNLGDGRALGSKWRLSFRGRWVMGLKDRIDRKFMRSFAAR